MLKKILIFIACILVLSMVLLYSVCIEPNKLVLKRYELKEWHLSGIKIVFVSDLHVKYYQKSRLRKVVKLINEQKPDLVLFGGDFADWIKPLALPIDDITSELSKIKSPNGIYTVIGENDKWYGKDIIVKSLSKNGITVLDNSSVTLNIQNKPLYIVGVQNLRTDNPDIKSALKDTYYPVIMLSHTPDIYPDIQKECTISLLLAGHTHGGQIRIPYVGPICTGSKFHDKYSQGYIFNNSRKMIVTTGVGTNILPVRMTCPPEIVVVSFK